jgi:DNA-nicking Smr family endonuclease
MEPSGKTPPPAPASDAGPDATAVELPIDGTLDLHTVRAAEVRDLLPEYLQAGAARGILEVRVVHGKGTGQLRRTVHALLGRSPLVAQFRAADEGAGGWGATLVTLRPPDGARGR